MSARWLANWLFFFPIIFLGVVTTRGDWRTRRIKNSWIACALLYAASAYIVLGVFHLLSPPDSLAAKTLGPFFLHFDVWAINWALAVLVAFGLYHFKMWAAGDAKLFIAYVSLYPFFKYPVTYFGGYFPSYFLLLAIFVPATFFIWARSLFFLLRHWSLFCAQPQPQRQFPKKARKLKVMRQLRIFFGFFVLFLAMRLVKMQFRSFFYGLPLGRLEFLVGMSCLFIGRLKLYFRRHVWVVALVLAVLVFVGIHQYGSWEVWLAILFQNLKRTLLVMTLVFLIRGTIDTYFAGNEQKYAPFAHWMFLGVVLAWLVG